MKTIDYVKFGLFCALLFIVVIEFFFGINLGSVSDLEQLVYYISMMRNLGLLDGIITIALFGALVFPQEEQ